MSSGLKKLGFNEEPAEKLSSHPGTVSSVSMSLTSSVSSPRSSLSVTNNYNEEMKGSAFVSLCCGGSDLGHSNGVI